MATPSTNGSRDAMNEQVSGIEYERMKQDLNSTKRELSKMREKYEVDKVQWESEVHSLRQTMNSMQTTNDTLTSHRNRESRERSDVAKQAEDLRLENAKMRKELSAALDTKLSHLRTPQVSFEQYRELLHLCEQYAGMISGSSTSTAAALSTAKELEPALKNAKQWTDNMGSAPYIATTPMAGVQQTPAAPTQPPQQQQQQGTELFGGAQLQQQPQIAVDLSAPTPRVAGHLATGNVVPISPQRAVVADQGGQIPSALMTAATSRSPSVNDTAAMMERAQQQAAASSASTTNAAERPIKENIVEGGKLVKIICDAAPNVGKLWSFNNTTTDTQFIVEFTFGPMCDIVPLGDTEREGRIYRLSLFPGDTKPFIRGVVNGYKMSVKYGPPDESFVPPSAMTDGELSPAVSLAQEISASLPAGTSTAMLMTRCLAQGIPFVDVSFPPLSNSVARASSGERVGHPIRWGQPSGFLPTGQRPEVLGLSPSPSDVLPGDFNTGYLAAALRAVGEDKELLHRMFLLCSPEEIGSGLYHIWLCKQGLWHDLVLDSFLPCDRQNHLCGMRSKSMRSLWPALTEKAMAKICGSYVAAEVPADPLDTLQDLTGYPTERFDWKTRETTLFGTLQKSLAVEGNIVILATPRPETKPNEGVLSSEARRAESIGLRLGESNRVVAVCSMEGYRLCLIRAPPTPAESSTTTTSSSKTSQVSTAKKWNGSWSEGSDIWLRHPHIKKTCDEIKNSTLSSLSSGGGVSPQQQQQQTGRLSATPEPSSTADELWWMDWRDVVLYFDGAGMCMTRPNWVDYRIPMHFVGTKPSIMLELHVTKTTNIFVGLHQADRRYAAEYLLPTSQMDEYDDGTTGGAQQLKPYDAFLITIVGCSPNGVWDTVAQSRGGNFWRGRDVHLATSLRANGDPYYVLLRRYSAEAEKDMAVSLQVERREAVNVNLRQPNEAVLSAVKYSPVWKFDPSPCPLLSSPAQVERETLTLPLEASSSTQHLLSTSGVLTERDRGGGMMSATSFRPGGGSTSTRPARTLSAEAGGSTSETGHLRAQLY